MRLREPGFADGLVRCEALEGLESSAEVVGGDEVAEMLPELIVRIVVVALAALLMQPHPQAPILDVNAVGALTSRPSASIQPATCRGWTAASDVTPRPAHQPKN